MKKIALLFVVLGLISSIKANEGTCIVPGTNEYVTVIAENNEDGTVDLVIINSSEKPLVSLNIKAYVSYVNGPFLETKLFYNSIYYEGVNAYATRRIMRINLGIGQASIENFYIEIGNPICKGE
jgi:hypothetical protein